MRSRGILVASFALSLVAGHALAQESPGARFGTIMDSAFGPGAWRMTGGYRSPERENELRAQGALTVPPGVLSRHSTGRPGAPGAYDLVVNGLSPAAAAARLRQANAPFRRYFAEGAHGTQGAHLHLEPHALDLSGAAAAPVTRRLPSVYVMVEPTPAELAFARLHAAASEGDADLQLQVARAYAEGRGVPRDRVPAFIWTAMAATNETASPEVRRDAERALALLTRSMTPAEVERARRFVRVGDEPCTAQPMSIVLRLSGGKVEPAGACASHAAAGVATGR